MSRAVLIFTVVLTAISVLLCLVSVSVPYWLYTEDPELEYQGLWTRCRSINGVEDCFLIKLPPEFLDATRVMMLFGLAFFLLALVFGCTYTCCKPEKTKYTTAALVFMLMGSVACLIAVIVYAAKYDYLLGSDYTRLHAGFGLAVVTTGCGVVTSFFYCLVKAREE